MIDGSALTEDARLRGLAWGRRLLLTAFAACVVILLYLAAKAPDALPYFAALAVAVPAVVFLFSRPRLNLLVVLCAFVLIADYEPGLQARELLYGLYFLAFLAHWFVRTIYLERQQVIRNDVDRALLLFLVWAGLSGLLAIFLGTRPKDVVGEALVLMMLGVYFPVRHACRSDERTFSVLLIAGGALALYTTARNLMFYRAALSDATFLWQIATGRVPLNESLLMFPALVALVLLLYVRSWWIRGFLLGMLTLLVGALIATQSRGYWVAFMMGVVVLMLLVDRRRRKYFFLFAVGTTTSFLLLASLMIPDVLNVVAAGLTKRFLSLGSALTSDISLVSRVYESRALLAEFVKNPVIGHGIGTPFRFFDVISDATRNDAYTHNMIAGTLFKTGVVGLALVLWFWIRTILRALRLYRTVSAPATFRLAGMVAVVCLSAELVVANTSNPLLIADASLAIAMIAGSVSGGWDHLEERRPIVPRKDPK